MSEKASQPNPEGHHDRLANWCYKIQFELRDGPCRANWPLCAENLLTGGCHLQFASFPMDDPVFCTVAQGTLITCESVFSRIPGFILNPQTHFLFNPALITGLGVGAFETFKGRPGGIPAATSALNGGLVAVTFFCGYYSRFDQTTHSTNPLSHPRVCC